MSKKRRGIGSTCRIEPYRSMPGIGRTTANLIQKSCMLQRDKRQSRAPGLHPDMTGLGATFCDSASVLLNATVGMPRGSYRYFGPAAHERARTRQLALDLPKALPRGEFQVFYQPIVSAATQEIVSFEALLRWNHPLRGHVPPDDFVHLAEEAGLIDKIGEWVLRQACAECAAWPLHIRVAVNFSATQFRNRNIAAMVACALDSVNLSANRLEIEITESCLLLDDAATLDRLQQLRALGVRIAMDDFGIGYSALSYLPRFPFDKIKIDKCFLQDHAISDIAGRMLEAIAAMASTLKIAMTVEGVETQEQLTRIRALGCSEMQGFIFGRPMPANDAEDLIASEAMEYHAA